jgi:hypothetical protein
MRWKNTIRAYGIWLGLSLYTNVVVLALWDWFAVPALHVPDVSYWQFYGVTLLLAILFSPPDSGDRHQLTMISMQLEAVLPEDKRLVIQEALQEQQQEKQARNAMVFSLISRISGNTTVLIIGWTIHTFLA